MFERYITPGKRPLLLSLLIFLFAFLLYRNTVPNGYTLDDDIYYTGNKFVQQGFKGMGGIFTKSTFFGHNGRNDILYRPLPLSVFAIQHSIYGNNPHFNHFFNVLVYALGCSLLLILLRLLFIRSTLAIPCCITLLFTAHPIHTEVVASIKGLDEILAFLFLVLTLLFLLSHIDRRRPILFAVSALLFFLCLLCKEHGLTYLGIIPLALYTFRAVPLKRIILLMLPFCCVAALYIALRAILLDHFTFGEPLRVINNTLIAADNRADQLATAFVILGKYLKLLFIPYPLCWDYSYNQIPVTTWANPKAIFSFVVYTGMLVAGVFGTVKKNHLAFAALFFLLSFSISSNLIIKIGTTLGERLLFTPSLGFCIAMVLLFSTIPANPRYMRILAVITIAIILSLYSLVIVNRNTDWKDNFTLVSRDITKNPESAPAHAGLGDLYLYKSHLENAPQKKAGFLFRAITEFRQSVGIYPGYASAWYRLGDAWDQAGQPDSAIKAYQKAIQLNPQNTSAANKIGILYTKLNCYDSAANYFRKILSVDTGNVIAYLKLGTAEFLQKNYAASLTSYKKAHELDPENKLAIHSIYQLSLMLKDTVRARQYRPAIERMDSLHVKNR